jgi:putative ABC transport system permease protein
MLRRLLPPMVARDIFEPALCDLRVRRLTRRAECSSKVERIVSDGWHLVLLVLLFLDCWRLALADAPRSFHAVPSSTPVRPREPLHMLRYHLRHAVRRLVRDPSFTIAAVLTLALGVGANIAVFTVVEAVLLRPLPYAESDRLVTINHRDDRTGITKQFVAIGDFVDIKARQSAFASIGAYMPTRATMVQNAEPYRVSVLAADAGLFETLRLRPALGRVFHTEDSYAEAAPVVILGNELWKSRFGGDPAIVGRSVRIDDRDVTVVGVAPEGFRFPPNAKVDIFVPQFVPAQAPASRRSDWTFAMARLKPTASLQKAMTDLAGISRQMASEHPSDNQASVYFGLPLRDALAGNTKPALLLLLASVAVLLLIACANVANLLLARALGRRREMALRMALGAGRGRLAVQLVSESMVLAVAGCAAGLLIANWGARALVALAPQSESVPGLSDVHIDARVLAFALAIAAAATLVFGMVALLTTRLESGADVLVSGARSSMTASARRATSTIVVGEVAFAVVLLVGAGLILRSFAALVSVNPGFEVDRVVTLGISLPSARYAGSAGGGPFYDRALPALRALPGVAEVGAAVVVPLTGNNWTTSFERPEQPVAPGERAPEVGWQVASGGFFRALKIPLIAGRLFDERDRPGGKQVVIISDALAKRFFPGESAVGKMVGRDAQEAEIVGVVGSIRRAALEDEPRADMYFPFEASPSAGITLFIRTTADPLRSIAAIKAAIREIEPATITSEARTLADVANESIRVIRLVLWLLGIFAATALALAVVGIYAVMSYVVRQRTREIGTRLALGAQRGNILWLILRQGASIAFLGAVIGVALAAAGTRLLRSVLYATSSTDPLVMIVAPLLLVGATLIACYLPARRAASVDPAKTLSQPT